MKDVTARARPLRESELLYEKLDQIQAKLHGALDLIQHRLHTTGFGSCECHLEAKAPVLFIQDALGELDDFVQRFRDFADNRDDQGGAQ